MSFDEKKYDEDLKAWIETLKAERVMTTPLHLIHQDITEEQRAMADAFIAHYAPAIG